MLKSWAKFLLKTAVANWVEQVFKLPEEKLPEARLRLRAMLGEYLSPEQAASLTEEIIAYLQSLHRDAQNYALSQIDRI